MAAMALNREQIVALVDERLQVMVPGFKHSMGARLHVIINEANAASQKFARGHGAVEGIARRGSCKVYCR